jgi:hypothetical protein
MTVDVATGCSFNKKGERIKSCATGRNKDMRDTTKSILVDLGCFYSYAIFMLVYGILSILSGDLNNLAPWGLLLFSPIIAVNGLTGLDGVIGGLILPICIIIAALVIGVKLKQKFLAAIVFWPLVICIAASVGCYIFYGKLVRGLLRF